MPSNFLVEIKAKMRLLAPKERKIAEAILAHPESLASLSLADFASRVGVAQGSVINFAKKHTGGGFPQMKTFVALACNEGRTDNAVSPTDGAKTALVKTVAADRVAFELTCERNGEEVLSRVVAHILSARKVEIYGVFRSAAVATDFCYQLLELGIPASFVSDILTCAISSTMLAPDDLVVAVSSSGRTADVLDAVRNAKAKGVRVLAITGDGDSPIAKHADDVLIACAGDGDTAGGTVRASQFLLTDAICATIRARQSDAEKTRYTAIRKILSSHNVKEGEHE